MASNSDPAAQPAARVSPLGRCLNGGSPIPLAQGVAFASLALVGVRWTLLQCDGEPRAVRAPGVPTTP